MCDVLLFLLNLIKLFKCGMFFRNVCSFLIRKLTNQKTYIKFLQHFGRKTEFTPILVREQFDDNISGVT
jgi:hypothetical protein